MWGDESGFVVERPLKRGIYFLYQKLDWLMVPEENRTFIDITLILLHIAEIRIGLYQRRTNNFLN